MLEVFIYAAIVTALLVGGHWALAIRGKNRPKLQSTVFLRERLLPFFALVHIWGYLAGPLSQVWLTHFVGLQGFTLVLAGQRRWYVLLSPIGLGLALAFAPPPSRVFCVMAWDVCAACFLYWRVLLSQPREQEIFATFELLLLVDATMPLTLGCAATVAALATLHLLIAGRMTVHTFTGVGPPPYTRRDIRDLTQVEFDSFLVYVQNTTAEVRYETVSGNNVVALWFNLQRWVRGKDDEAAVQRTVINEHIRQGGICFVPLDATSATASKEYLERLALHTLQVGWGENFFAGKELARTVISDESSLSEDQGVELDDYY